MKPGYILMLLVALSGVCSISSQPVQASPTTIQGPAGQLHFDDGGSGLPTVILIHSFAGNSTHWAAQLKHLRRSSRAIAIDVRGHGRSDRPNALEAFAVPRMAEDLAAVVDGLGLERVVHVGSSMGGPIALAYAQKHFDKVAGIMLVGPPGRVPADQAEKIVGKLQADYRKAAGEFLDGMLKGATKPTEEQITKEFWAFPQNDGLAIIESLFDFDPLPAVDANRGPIILVNTQQNNQPTDLTRLRPDLPAETLGSTSHWPHMDKPDEFNAILDRFIAKVRN